MRTEEEIRNRLRGLDGQYLPKEVGGRIPYGEAKALLWALGYDYPYPTNKTGTSDHIDVSEYLDD